MEQKITIIVLVIIAFTCALYFKQKMKIKDSVSVALIGILFIVIGLLEVYLLFGAEAIGDGFFLRRTSVYYLFFTTGHFFILFALFAYLVQFIKKGK